LAITSFQRSVVRRRLLHCLSRKSGNVHRLRFLAVIARRRMLTISDTRVSRTPNHQSFDRVTSDYVQANSSVRSTSRQSEKPSHMSAFQREKVLSVRHWTDSLFSFIATRNSGFRFRNGQFVMIGREVDGRPLTRAYSMASANHEE
jgi:hypothetical protein